MGPGRVGSTGLDAQLRPGDEQALFGISAQFVQFEGPLPHPALLEQYERAFPGAADRIFRMSERALDAEIEREQTPIRAEAIAFISTSIAVAWLPWIMLIGAVILAVAGASAAATIVGALGVMGGGAQIIQAVRPKVAGPPGAPRRAKPDDSGK